MNFTANYAGVTYTHGYTLNDKNQRTGIILADGKNWNFSYDNIGQVTGAMLNNSGNLLSNYSYNYDQIGNRIQATKDNNITSYTSNIVNQYTQINTAVPTYDQDGNMLTNGEWNYIWNGENRMILAQTTTRKVEFAYDYMGRCFERKEYTAVNNSWNLDQTVYIVYDEYKQIAEYVNGELHQQYAWDVAGLDTVAFMGKNNSTYMYWTDGNKNVLKLFDATGILASYSYDPFGKVATSEGLLATDNPFRFSSEYHNDITGLVEYIYRKYDSNMGRWINRDPIEEQGGANLYRITYNNSIDLFDTKGLFGLSVKLLSIYAIRFYSMRSHSRTYELDDDNQELLGTVYEKIHQKMKEYSKANGLSRKWKRFVLPYIGMGEIKQSTNYFLNDSNGGVFTKGNFYARCYNGNVLARNAAMLYFWHDEIDANSTEETIARYYTNNGKINLSGYLSDIPHQLENAWDEHAEKYMVPNFRVIVKGNYNFIYEKLL